MSSFEKTAGKNLDEILASIRKTLADKSTPPQPGFPQPDPLAEASAGEPARRNGDRIDDDFADLLAGGLGVSPSQPQEKDTTAPEPAEPKDPLWFLRPSGGGEPQALSLPDHGPRLAPETLADGIIPPPQRPSFSPQFIADRARSDGVANGTSSSPSQEKPSAASPSAPDPGTATETKPAATGLAPDAIGPGTANREAAQMAPGAGQAAAGAAAPATSPAGRDADSKLGVPPASAAKPDPARPAGAGVPVSPSPAVSPGALPLKPEAAQAPAALGGMKPVAAGPAKPTAPAAVVSPAAMAGPAIKGASAAPRAAAGLNGVASAARSAAAASMPAANAVPASQTQALEQIIEQLLEPLLRRWVEANLPRMVEAAIRAEVARVLDKKSPNGHASDRKL